MKGAAQAERLAREPVGRTPCILSGPPDRVLLAWKSLLAVQSEKLRAKEKG